MSPAERVLRSGLRAWIGDHLPDDLRGLPDHVTEPLLEPLRGWSRSLHEAGHAVPHWPVEHGGHALDLPLACALHDELARSGAPAHLGSVGLLEVGAALLARGTVEQRARHLTGIPAAETIWCAAAAPSAQRARKSVILSGTTGPIPLAHVADRCLLALGPEVDRAGSALLDLRSPGVVVEPVRGPAREVDRALLHLHDVAVLPDDVLGSPETAAERVTTLALREAWAAGRAEALARRVAALVHERGATAAERAGLARTLAEARALRRRRAAGETAAEGIASLRRRLTLLALDHLGADGLLLPPNAPYAGAWTVEALLA